METFNLNTSQNVDLQYQIASLGDRILAYLLDALFIGSYFLFLLLIFSSNLSDLGGWFLLFFIPVIFYHLLFEMVFNGQSPGKMIMRIKVVKTDGSHLTFGACFIRWIFRIIDVSLLAGAIAVLIIIINGKGQRIGDIAASTTVLRIHKKKSMISSPFMNIEKSYTPHFHQVELLSDKDILIVKEVLDVYRKSPEKKSSQEILLKTREAISKKMAVTSEMTDIQFLYAIVKDYNSIHMREPVNV
ncbi:RDD family protein [Natronoflexus pectinivorans]|uniref:Putative RDD family membrane protein YckC n=1 Tax=Natronoflexus pectinivorans TaxID=682526 RepID=A0A4R2GNV4_9BACT|nr:RDD family protein [Natronoflexus pectinivorans]TCO10770.1 putative RDD family membrane protein YckC [Natronoflexus pectinivorans]